MLEEHHDNFINMYEKKCNDKIEFHRINSRNSRIWDQLLSNINVLLTSFLGLSLVLLNVYNNDSATISIVSACYGCAISIFQKIENSYDFKVLNVLHTNAYDDFTSISIEINELKYRNDDNRRNLIIQKYDLVASKSHYREIQFCFFETCFCS